MQNPKISVITPTYNQEKYIIQCIKSVQQQTFTNWEMIIVNDGSTDNTRQIIEDYIKTDSRIILFNQENKGIFRLGETYNYALNKCTGEYIGILEGDDTWHEQKLERQIEALEADKDSVLCWGKANIVNGDMSEIIKIQPPSHASNEKYFNNKPVGSILNLLYIENCITALTILIRKSTLLNIGGFIQSSKLPLVDLTTLIVLSTKGTYCYIPYSLGNWRTYPEQTTKKYVIDILEGRNEFISSHFSNLPTEIRKHIHLKQTDINKHFNTIRMTAYVRSGRYKAKRKEFLSARNDYKTAMFYSGPLLFLWRLRALIGFSFSLIKLDTEWLSGLLGKQKY